MKHRVTQKSENSTERKESFLGEGKSLRVERGDVVIAKIASGQLVQRRVWSVSDAVVFLCSERLYSNLLIGASRLWPIGFPKSDVRRLNSEAGAPDVYA